MYLTEKISNFPSFTPFRTSAKRSLPNNFDLISGSFDESVLCRLKTLNPPSFSLSWLSLAVGFLSSTHAEARTLIANLSDSTDDSLALYLEGSVKILDICNSLSAEIERLRQRRLLINFVLQLLDFSSDGSRNPSTEKLRKVQNSLSDWENRSIGSTKRRTLQIHSPETLIRDLVAGLGSPPRGKISSAGKLIRRTVYAVGVLTVFVAGVAVTALCGVTEEIAVVRAPAEFVWAESFNDLQSAISGKMNRRFLEEIHDLETRVRAVRDVINGAVEGDGENRHGNIKEEKVKDLGNVVKKLGEAAGGFSDGLDRLSNGVNGMFHTVLSTRNGALEKYRKRYEDKDEKQLK